MSDSLMGGASAFDHGFVASSPTGTAVTANATVDTVGGFVELVTAADNIRDSNWLMIQLDGRVDEYNFLINFAIGESGFEEIILGDLWFFSSVNVQGAMFTLDKTIPAGVRISVNCQSNVSAVSVNVFISRAQRPGVGYAAVDTYGADRSTTRGTLVQRAAAGTFGNWTEITPSILNDLCGFFIAAHRDSVTSWTSGTLAYQVAIGPVDEEEIISPTMLLVIGGAELIHPAISPVLPIGIAAGQRVSIRTNGSATNADFDLDFVLYGVRY